MRADRVAVDLPASAWQRRSAGTGSKGPRFCAWAWLDDVWTDADPDDGGHHSLLIRRNTTTGELAFYRCWTPRQAALAQLVRVAGIRWTVEESFQAAKGQVGLDQHQVRRWTPGTASPPWPWPPWPPSPSWRSAPPTPTTTPPTPD
ncbi:hypothetical protein [Micromonospora sp. NPDC001898]|uniref:hypothetical protein n=1 Tax=Micromonospora sp. NPDC001898 TaxID=3364221 RepID=UPI0036C60686